MSLMTWWRNFTKRDHVERDLDAEIRSAYDLLVDEKLAEGATFGTARRAASLEIGGIEQIKDRVRDVRIGNWCDSLRRDVGFAVRMLRRNPGFTLLAAATFALGIGANTAVFSIIDGVLLKPLPYPHADRIVGIWERTPSGQPNAMSTQNYVDYATQNTVFDRVSLTSVCCGSVTLTDIGEPPRTLARFYVSSTYFDIFEAKAALGRTFLPGEDHAGRDHVVVISHKLWSTLFGSDGELVGKQIRLNDEAYTVIGVMPANSPFDQKAELWMPLSLEGKALTRRSHDLISVNGDALARLKPGVTLEQARAEMDGIAARLSRDYPASNKGWGVVVEPYASIVVGSGLRQFLYLLACAVGLVLLIACVNLANLLLARALARDHEVAVRFALGAGRSRLIQQFLVEGLLLSFGGGIMGIAAGGIIRAGIVVALRTAPFDLASISSLLPAEATIGLDLRVLSFTLALASICGIGFGLVPAFASIRGNAGQDLGPRTGTPVRHRRLRSTLIVGEVALAVVLLTNVGLLVRSLVNMRQADIGIDATNVVAAWLPLDEHRLATAEELHAFMRQVPTRVDALPGVRDAAFTEGLPFQGAPYGIFFEIAGRRAVDRALRPVCNLKVVTPEYFQVVGLRLHEGRTLTDADRSGAPRVVVINETMARMYFEHQNPLGQYLLMEQRPWDARGNTAPVPWEIVGVIGDEQLTPFDDRRPQPAVYATNEQFPSSLAELVIRTASGAGRISEALRHAIALIDRDQAVMNITTFHDIESESMMPDQLRLYLLTVFAAMALLLAVIGIYGVIGHSVTQRTREIGIRAALGATKRALVALILKEGMMLAFGGVVLGCTAALGATQLLRTVLFGVSPWDLMTMAVVAVFFVVVAAFACYVPARRASRINPLIALRYE